MCERRREKEKFGRKLKKIRNWWKNKRKRMKLKRIESREED